MFKKILMISLFPLAIMTRYFKGFLLVLLFFVAVGGLKENTLPYGNLVELQLVGAILDSSGFVEQVQEVSDDDQVKGVLLVIDSPGGELSPSVELYEEVKRLNLKKPVVVYTQGSLASGGYYAALGASRIVANKAAMIGSIGVIYDGLNVSGLMQKLGIKSQIIRAGKYKEVGTISREWEEYERQELEELLYRQYDMFVRDVVAARGLRYEDKDTFAEGRVFDARKALELGLIDELGTKNDAKEALIDITGLDGQEFWREPSEVEKFLDRIRISLNAFMYALMLRG